MITTLTLNPCVDRTIEFNGFQYGGTNKVTAVRSDVSGKGINVSIALHQLGSETVCVGFNYSDDAVLERSLDRMGIAYDFVEVPGKLRTNIKAFDTASRVMTEFNESGARVTAVDVEKLMQKVDEYIQKSDLLVINGSAPPGVPADTYRRIIQKINAQGKKAVLDAYGELLLEGIKAAPFLIKPNRDELEAAFGRKIETHADAIAISRQIIAQGVVYVCISMGKDGALLVSRDSVWFSPGADIKVRGVQGAGDSLVAGICMAILAGLPDPDILRWGVAVAHGSLMREGTQMCTSEDFQKMLNVITAEKISASGKEEKTCLL